MQTDSRAARRELLAFAGAYVILSVAFCWPLFAQPTAGGTGDWDQHTFYYAAVLRSLVSGHLPFWNPWYCGGNVLWQNPQVSLVSPVYLLALTMPLNLAMKLNVVGHYLVGCAGMHLLVRRIMGVRSPLHVIFVVALAVFSGGMALHIRTGHVNFLSVFWLPALVYCFYRAAEGRRRSAIAGGAIVAIAVLNGGPHVVPLAAVLLGSLGLGALLVGRTLKPILLAILIVIAGAAYAAPKLVPAARFTQMADFQDRRPVKHPDAMSVEMLRRALSDGSQGTELKVTPGVQKYPWHEYGNYMGWFGAGLSLISAAWILAFRHRRDQWPAAAAGIGLVVVLLLAAGEFAAYAPATLIRKLPFFANFRIPSRHILLVPIAGAACVAFMARAWEDQRRSPLARRVVEALCIVGVVQLVLVNREAYRDVFILPPATVEARSLDQSPPVVAEHEPPSAAWTGLGENSNFLRTMIAGVSQLNCYEQLMVKRIAQPGPEVITGEGAVALSGQTFSSNRVAATVTVGNEPVRVILNENFADGWSTTMGAVERDPASGRPSVTLPAGYRGTVAFTYTPPGLEIGIGVALLAVLLSVTVWKGTAS